LFTEKQQQSKGEYKRMPQVLRKSIVSLFVWEREVTYCYMQGCIWGYGFAKINARFFLVGVFLISNMVLYHRGATGPTGPIG